MKLYVFFFKVKKRLKMILSPLLEMRKKKFLADRKCESPVIVLGNQKTGSTAIAALLSQASGKSVTLDVVRSIPDVTWQLGIKYDVQYFRDYAWKYRQDFYSEIIKEPSFTFFYAELSEIFPNAKFVFIQRNPFQNIRSILDRLKIPGNLDSINFDEHEELNKGPIWRLVLDSHWLGFECNNYIEGLAYRWNLAAQIYLDNADKFNLVRYEDFLVDKKGTVDELCKSFGLPVVENVGNSVDKQHQSKGQSNVDLKAFFGERNYSIIESICYKNGKRLGYF